MWENMVECDRPQMTIRPMSLACWITTATKKHSEYVMFVALLHYNSAQNGPPSSGLFVEHNVTTKLSTFFCNKNYSEVTKHIVFQRRFVVDSIRVSVQISLNI
jgi:hypothetical protein